MHLGRRILDIFIKVMAEFPYIYQNPLEISSYRTNMILFNIMLQEDLSV